MFLNKPLYNPTGFDFLAQNEVSKCSFEVRHLFFARLQAFVAVQLRSLPFWMFRSVEEWLFVTDLSGYPIGPIF
jgi:hypothetical protein